MRDILDDGGVPDDSLSRVFVETRHSKEGFRRLDALLREPRSQNHAWGVPLLGPARCGKTTFMAEFLRSCAEGEEGRRPLKHLYVKLDADVRRATIAQTTLSWMRDPNPGYGNAAQKGDRVMETIGRRRFDIIVYDEAHHLVDSETLHVAEKGASWFNEILDLGQCPLILIGYDRFESVLQRNESLAGRLLPFPRFRALDFRVPDDLREAAHVLRHIEENLGLPTPSRLDAPDTAARICVTCGGKLGMMAKFLTYARALARERRHSCLMPEVLRDAAGDMLAGAGGITFNPFEVDDLAAAVAKHGHAQDKRSSARKGGRQ